MLSGMARASQEDLQCDMSSGICRFNGEIITFIGLISQEPQRSYDWQKLNIKVSQCNISNARECKGSILVSTQLYPEYAYGDKVEITCRLDEVKSFNNFRYDKYLALDDIYSVCYFPKIKFLVSDQGNYFYKEIFLLKTNLQNMIDKYVDAPQAQILSAMILGNKGGLSDDFSRLFSNAGISHILAISGMHISILGLIILFLLNFIGISRRKAFYFSSIFIFIYITMIGFPTSAVRAGIMAFLVLAAIYFGRVARLINALLLAAFLMLLFQPGLLFYDVGFQFSFIALLGIFYLSPIIKRELRIPMCKPVWDLLSITLAAEIMVIPLVIYYFGLLSVVAPLMNLLIIWLIPFIMFLGILLFFIGSLNLFFPFFKIILRVIGIILTWLLGYIISAAKIVTLPRWTVLNIERFPLWAVLISYFAIIAVIIKFKNVAILK